MSEHEMLLLAAHDDPLGVLALADWYEERGLVEEALYCRHFLPPAGDGSVAVTLTVFWRVRAVGARWSSLDDHCAAGASPLRHVCSHDDCTLYGACPDEVGGSGWSPYCG